MISAIKKAFSREKPSKKDSNIKKKKKKKKGKASSADISKEGTIADGATTMGDFATTTGTPAANTPANEIKVKSEMKQANEGDPNSKLIDPKVFDSKMGDSKYQSMRATEDTKREKDKLVKEKANIKDFVEGTYAKGISGLLQEFRSMKRVNNFSVMQEFVKYQTEGRNRYKDVGCLDANRVALTIGPVPYIHANYVKTESCEKRFICTQAPLQKTCQDFWYMVLQEQSTVILMLCNIMEKGAKKCEQYFPEKVGATLTFGPITVTSKKSEELKLELVNNEISRTKVIVTDIEVSLQGTNPHTCHHYQWVDWPDRGVPEVDAYAPALLAKFKNVTRPIVVHCSAGIGRTGCIVLLEYALDQVKRGKKLSDMKELVELLRTQRNNSIQTDHQYLYVHAVLLYYFKATDHFVPHYHELYEQFIKDYKKEVAGSEK